MNTAERMGVRHMAVEFRRTYEANFAPIFAEFQDPTILESAVYWICREVDSLVLQGHNLNNILTLDPLMRRLAAAGANASRPQGDISMVFEHLSFNTQMFYMNLTNFVIRFLNR